MAAAFSSSFDGQQQKPFNLDSSLFLANNPLSMFDHTNTTTNSMDHHLYSSSSSILMTTHHHHHKYNNNDDDIITTPNKQLMIKKKKMMRKSKHYPFSPNSSTQSKEKKGKNQKKMRSSDVDEEKKPAPTGYIHVRARRGQATDSHSLAERVRREKISERMKLLQAIVPGCEKVSGKALMLDEIINYVQSLQNQVEFLSMKLASVNPMYYDFETDLEPFMVNGLEDDQMRVRVQQDLSNSVALGISMQMQSPTTVNKHPHLLDTYFLYAHPHPQAAGCRETQLWGVDELRHNYNTNYNNNNNNNNNNQLESGSGQQQPVFFPLI